MKQFLLLLCLAVMTACAQRTEPTTQAHVVANELDSMCYCLNAFDDAFGLGDTVAETDEGSDALGAWDAMLERDTIDVAYARGVFSILAHEMVLVLDAQLEYDPDNQTVVEFDNRWRKFLLFWCDLLEE